MNWLTLELLLVVSLLTNIVMLLCLVMFYRSYEAELADSKRLKSKPSPKKNIPFKVV